MCNPGQDPSFHNATSDVGPSFSTLMAQLPGVPSAPRDNKPIHILCTRPSFGARVSPNRSNLTPKGGAEGDRCAEHGWLRTSDGAPDPRIQVAIIGKRLPDLIWDGSDANCYPVDTITADMDISEQNLPVGNSFADRQCHFAGL